MKIVFLRHENLIDVCDTGRRNVPDVHLEFPRFSRSEFAPKAVALHARVKDSADSMKDLTHQQYGQSGMLDG